MLIGNALAQRGTKGRMEHLLLYIILGQNLVHNLMKSVGEFLVIEQRLHELTTGVCACVTLIHVFEKRKKTRFKQRTGIRLQNL